MEEGARDHEIGQKAEHLVGQIEAELKYDEEGRSYLEHSAVMRLVFRVTEFMQHLAKRILQT